MLVKEDPDTYGYPTEYDPNEGGNKYKIPKEGYAFLKELFDGEQYDASKITPGMSIVAGTGYLAYCYMLKDDFLLGIERYNGGGNRNYLEEVIDIYNLYADQCE